MFTHFPGFAGSEAALCLRAVISDLERPG